MCFLQSIFKTHLETSIKFLTKKNLKANEVKIAYNETITILNSLRAQVSSHVQNNWPDIILEFLIGDKVRAFCRCDPVRFLCAMPDGLGQGRLCGQRHPVPIMVVFIHVANIES